MPPLVVWVSRLQALALLGLAIAVVVLAATSTTSLGGGFVITEVVACLVGAWLFGYAVRWRRARAPILLFEVIAVGIAGQLFTVGRWYVALPVGLPALAVAIGVLATQRDENRPSA